jgi:signal transduction histidine kinase
VGRGAVTRRVLAAAGLLAGLLGALLVAWFVSGWADVRGQQRALRDEPTLAAARRSAQLAHDLRGALAVVIGREADRPYFHYQNLFHDPRASRGASVAPSPLAGKPEDPMVLGYFQLDGKGRVSTPAINDELPELSDAAHLADHRRFRDEVVRSLAGPLAPPVMVAEAPAQVAEAAPVREAPVRVAEAAPVRAAPARVARAPTPRAPVAQEPPPQVASQQAPVQQAPVQQAPVQQAPTQQAPVQQAPGQQAPVQQAPVQQPPVQQAPVQQPPVQQQVVKIDRDVYALNSSSNEVYRQQNLAPARRDDRLPGRPEPARPEPAAPADEPKVAAEPARPDEPARPEAAPAKRPTPARTVTKRVAPRRAPEPAVPASVAITVSPLEWRTLEFAGQPSLVAVRQVDTPDGRLAQGFVLDRTALTGWLADHAGSAIAELRTGDDGSADIAPGWHLEVVPNPLDVAAAGRAAAVVARGFVGRFVGVGAIALVTALFVVLLVARAERLARERSQFAAAAAHELRTPLAGLQLYGDMLADGLGDPAKLRDYARRMSEEAARLGRVVSNVLGFSQLERGNLSVEVATGSLEGALRELADRAEPALDRAGAQLALDVPPDLQARFDRDALARIVGNLLDNAEKYGRASDDRTITLAARPTGAAVEVTVSDHGPGLPPGVRLFQPFARGVTADGPAGLGLGLALSQSLARAMGGDLTHRGSAGGATFVLTLPA